jgi:hypothetical protein
LSIHFDFYDRWYCAHVAVPQETSPMPDSMMLSICQLHNTITLLRIGKCMQEILETTDGKNYMHKDERRPK